MKQTELEKLSSIIDKRHQSRRKLLHHSNRTLKKLLVTDDTDADAMYLLNENN